MAKAIADIRSLARAHTEAAITTLAGIMRQRSAPPSARVAACGLLIERGWGKAVQPIAGDDGGPINVIIRQVIDIVDESAMKTIEHEADDDQLELALPPSRDK